MMVDAKMCKAIMDEVMDEAPIVDANMVNLEESIMDYGINLKAIES